jgi:Tfp pilus assembly protein PilF
LTDPEALIRHTAVRQLSRIEAGPRKTLLVAMLYDPVKAVRMEAANQISAIADPALRQDHDRVYRSGLDEYTAAMTYSADFAFGRFNLGNLSSNLKQAEQAAEQYQAAIKIDNQFYPAKVNLAMLYNRKGDNAAAERLFRETLALRDDLPEVHYSLGLLLAEEKRYTEAVQYLETASQAMPHYARVHYNAGQIWDYLNRPDKAQAALERSYALEPQNPDYLKALVRYYVKHDKFTRIEKMAQRILAQDPENAVGRQLRQFVDRMAKAKAAEK